MKFLALFMALFAGVVFWVLNDDSSSGVPGVMPSFHSSYESVVNASKASGKPVVLIFSAPWCPPCQMMKKSVYPSAEVASVKDRFEWAYLDVDLPGTRGAAAKYQVRGIPAVFIISPESQTLAQRVGGVGASEFAAWLRESSGG